MTKKLFTFILVVTLILASSCVFATNELQDSMNKSGNTLRNIVDGAGTVLQDAGTTITHGVQDVGNAIGNGARDVGGSISSDMTRSDNMGNDNNDYTAVRTANDGTIMGMNANTWTWLVLGIAALAIVALVWYYAMQNKNEYDHYNE